MVIRGFCSSQERGAFSEKHSTSIIDHAAYFYNLPYFLSVLLIYGYTKNRVEQHEIKNSSEEIQNSSKALEQYFQDMVDLSYILQRNPSLIQSLKNGSEDSSQIEKSIENFYLMRKRNSTSPIFHG